jgi:uncharacterized protein YdaU (DUF1376 family)
MAQAELAWMPLHVDDYRSDTNGRSAEFHGAYLLLIMHYWRTGPLPDDDGQLALVAACTPDRWAALRPALAGFFTIKDGEWRHKRVDKELAKARAINSERVKSGRRGAAKRWASRNSEMAEPLAEPLAKPMAKRWTLRKEEQKDLNRGSNQLDQTSSEASTDSLDGKVVRLPLTDRGRA